MRTYGIIIRPPKGAKHMAYEEIKQEISSKHGISLSELSKLVGLKLLEKGVTEEGALGLVSLDLEKKKTILKQPSQSFIDSINAEEYLFDYAKAHHPDDPEWYKKAVEKEYKSGRFGIDEEDAVKLAALSYGWNAEGKSNIDDAWNDLDNLSEKSLSVKIKNGHIDTLTAKINRLSKERPYSWEHRFRIKSRGIELTDGKYNIWANCYDTCMFKDGSGNIVPANPMLERIRALERKYPLVGVKVTLTNLETGRNRKGYITLATGPDSDFLVLSEDYTDILMTQPVGADA